MKSINSSIKNTNAEVSSQNKEIQFWSKNTPRNPQRKTDEVCPDKSEIKTKKQDTRK